jgi:hypothetical protein
MTDRRLGLLLMLILLGAWRERRYTAAASIFAMIWR